MLSPDRLEVLREKNRALLAQLHQQRQRSGAVNGGLQSRKGVMEDGAEENSEAEEVVTVTDGDRGPARAALAKPTVTFSGNIQHSSAQTSSMTSELRTDDLKHSTSKSPRNEYCLKGQTTLRSEEKHITDSQRPRPLLGYDWIAGVIDAEDSLMERSEDFFNDLCTFRALNKDQCVNSLNTGFTEECNSSPPSRSEEDSPTTLKDSHKCTFSYRINTRLFPVPLNSQECCPVCKKHKSDHPHTVKEPALIRVSIPRSTILPSYKYKAHRRCSFNPSDSLGLPSHCLSGWSNKVQSSLTARSNLDLRSSTDTKKEAENKELENLPAFKASRQKPQQVPHVSLLTRHSFLHFSPRKRK
uniref:Migration and invasion inhibitory protein n=1 Tax=Neogobius melanostomus TaxID=47308 RepID=A0A8C6SRV2_9GOBI